MAPTTVVVFTAGGSRCTLTVPEASELTKRLRRRGGDFADPALVVAARLEHLLEDVSGPSAELRFLDSETAALSWTIQEWLNDVYATGSLEGIHCLRSALDAESRVEIKVRDSNYRLAATAATVLAENLRLKAAGALGPEGVEGARAVADAIEDVLVGRREGAIRLDDDGAEAVFYVLDTSFGSRTELVAEAYSLYEAVRAVARS